MDRVPPSEVSSTSSDSVPSSTQASDQTYETRLVIKGRAFDVEQFEAAVKRKFSKLNEQTLAGEVFGPGLEQLYETVSVMSNAFVERTEGGNVSLFSSCWRMRVNLPRRTPLNASVWLLRYRSRSVT